MAALAVALSPGQQIQLQLIQGKPVSLVAAASSGQIDSQVFQRMEGVGCDSVPGGTLVLSALLAMAGWLGLSRATAPSRARRRKR
jgi:hypothetical protein